jgi:hypothetical protein
MYVLSLNSMFVSIKPETEDNFHTVTMLFCVLRKERTLRKAADVLLIHHYTLLLDPSDGTLASNPPQNFALS